MLMKIFIHIPLLKVNSFERNFPGHMRLEWSTQQPSHTFSFKHKTIFSRRKRFRVFPWGPLPNIDTQYCLKQSLECHFFWTVFFVFVFFSTEDATRARVMLCHWAILPAMTIPSKITKFIHEFYDLCTWTLRLWADGIVGSNEGLVH